MSGKPTEVWDRARGRRIEERIYGGAGLSWLYGTAVGRFLADLVLCRPLPSRIAGWYQDRPASRRSIGRFVREFDIPTGEFEEADYRSFDDFFTRRFRAGARTFCDDPEALPAFAEGRYLAFRSVGPDDTFPVKGSLLSPGAVLGDSDRATAFEGGPLLVARLCPTDYHRFHYPDDGETERSWRIAGSLHSVHPLALAVRPRVFIANERRISLLRTRNLGRLAYVEVGAMNVGRIVQTHPEDRAFERGAEKGFFRFGASSILLFGEPGSWIPDPDLLERTEERIETLVRLGEHVGGGRRSS